MSNWSDIKRLSYVMSGERFSALARLVFPDLPADITPEHFRAEYRSRHCGADGWPQAFPVQNEKTVREGIVVFSATGQIEGRTTGSRRECSANGCPGWFIGVLWETGQQMYICSEGWHYTDDPERIDIVGGGEISARFVSPKPLGVHPPPRTEWPKKNELLKRKGWRIVP